MKIALKISLILNLGLLGCLAFTWTNRERQDTFPTPATPALNATAPTVATIKTPAITRQTEPQTFRWSQLESDDYRTYVNNLRAAGCPATTLRAIITADMDGVYTAKHDQLEQQLTAMQNGSWSERLTTYGQQQELTAQLQQLPEDERSEIDDLLGIKPRPVQLADAQPRLKPQLRQQPISLPLVMHNLDLSQLNLDDQQKQAFADVRQQFMDQIGGSSQNPNDPAYLARWQKAQPAADSMLEAMLGNDAYTKIQMLEYQKNLGTQP